MTVILSILSAKGGVGKTTTTTNLAASLVKRGKSVIALDGNITTPNLGLHLGVPLFPVTLHDVLRGRASIGEAMYVHPSGIKVVPASLSASAIRKIHSDRFQKALRGLFNRRGYILIDGAAGLGKEARAAMYASDGVIIVTNPEITAVADALKAIKLAERRGVHVVGVVVNRVAKKKYEMKIGEIAQMLECPIIGIIPEDSAVPESIAKRMPVVHYRPRARASIGFKKTAASLLGEKFDYRPGLIEQLFGWFR